jgi:type I restriction enzyme R subunit
MAQEFRATAERGEDLGLNADEMAFYDALETNQASVSELGDDILRKIAVELTDQLRKNVSVDWSVRETVRAKLRILVKRILRKYKYPPDLDLSFGQINGHMCRSHERSQRAE